MIPILREIDYVLAASTDGFDLRFVAFDMAVKSFALLGLIALIAWLMRRRSAAAVHRMWTLGFLGCLMIPVVALVAPKWSLPFVPQYASTDVGNRSGTVLTNVESTRYGRTSLAQPNAVPQNADRADGFVDAPAARIGPQSRADVSEGRDLASSSDPARRVFREARSEQAGFSASASLGTRALPARVDYSWAFIGLGVWFCGALFFLARMAWQQMTLMRLAHRCVEIGERQWLREMAEASRALALKRKVQLLKSPDSHSPMCAGVLRSVVIVPSDSGDWSAARRRQVLLHELAHVKRYDVLTQTTAGIVCALLWFNPLCWIGLFQMRKLRELACDDLVLASGQRASDYAGVLLDVARSYRHREYATAVGMIRPTNVEKRILAVLDVARTRVALSRRAAGALLALTAAAVMLIGTAGAPSVEIKAAAASDQTDADSEADSAKTAKGEGGEGAVDGDGAAQASNGESELDDDADAALRTMQIDVRDEKGEPIEGANVFASISEIDGKNDSPNRNYTTDEDGGVEITIPRRLRILRIWPSKAGYVKQFVNFAEGTHEEGLLIPQTFEFQLQTGHRLSGRVVDTEGEPIAGASVEVRVEVSEPYWDTNPEPMIARWLARGDDAAVTDEDGRWEITNAPGPKENGEVDFRLQVRHPDFAGVGDIRWGRLHGARGITSAQLRAGTATLTMDRGIVISGVITGPNGRPVTKGLVTWVDRPYWATGVNETWIDASGRYETKRLAPGEYPVTVLAPGFAPEQRTVQLSQETGDVDFGLEAGNPIRIEIVDSDGDPVPNAWVRIGDWRGTEAIYNHKHSNVPESGIPRQTNQQGVYAWDWAPSDGVEYRISAKGYDLKSIKLVAKEETHQVVLFPPITISGKVVDSESGEPIERFRVIPVKAFRPDFYSTSFQSHDVAEGSDGQYEIQINSHGQTGNRYRVRIEAVGYRTAFARRSLAAGDPPLEENFELERAPALVGTVVDESGRRVERFTVAVGTPTTAPNFRIDRPDDDFGVAFRVEGKSQFELPATFEPRRIRVFNDVGFAEVLRQPDEEIGTIRLQPWASVTGVLQQVGEPVPNEGIYFFPVVLGGLGDARFDDTYYVKTDANGRFTYDRLPPFAGSLRALLGPWRDSPLTSSQALPLDLQPGENRTVTLGGDGVGITGKVVATGRGDAPLDKNWSINYLISRDRGIDQPEGFPALGFDPADQVQASWFLDANRTAWLATRENYFVKLAPDGELLISGVPAGSYDLVLQLYEQPAGCLVETIGTRIVPIEITQDDIASGRMSLGEIEVECRAGPRPGQSMAAYRFADTSGRVRSIGDMGGRYVLMHVWASWCAPCMESMPDVVASVANLSAEPITFVGLNIDEDATKAKSVAEQGGWNWAQNYLGDDSDMVRQLAVSSVPTYYLVGPAGRLVTSATEWSQIKASIDEGLRGGSD